MTRFAPALALSALAWACSALDLPHPQAETAAEDDWWLPAWVQAEPEAMGFYGPNPPGTEDQKLKLVTFTWRDVEGTRGVFDWSILRTALADAQREGRRIYTRIENSHVEHCPAWLEIRHPGLARHVTSSEHADNFGNTLSGDFHRLWDAEFTSEFRAFLASFKAQGFGAHPALAFSYIPGAWAWGEYGLSFIDAMEADGLGPADYLSWFRATIDAYVDAYGAANAQKLMYTGHDYLVLADGKTDWKNTIGRNEFAYAAAKGCGTRWGLLEKYDFLMGDMPSYGAPAVLIGNGRYQVVDDDAPMIHRPIGSESEELGNSNIPIESYRQLKMTALRCLQLRVSTVFMAERVWSEADTLHRYMMKTLGKQVDRAPDAFCVLREGADRYQEWSRYHLGHRGPWITRNLERWLLQREVAEDGRTVAVYQDTSNPVLYTDDPKEARRTDHASGSDYIYFNVHDRFLHQADEPVLLKVTWFDDVPRSWWVDYDGVTAAYQRSEPITGVGDRRWKTSTLALTDARFGNRQRSGMDFRICNGGSHDLVVRFVRLIKVDDPSLAHPAPGPDPDPAPPTSDPVSGPRSSAGGSGDGCGLGFSATALVALALLGFRRRKLAPCPGAKVSTGAAPPSRSPPPPAAGTDLFGGRPLDASRWAR